MSCGGKLIAMLEVENNAEEQQQQRDACGGPHHAPAVAVLPAALSYGQLFV